MEKKRRRERQLPFIIINSLLVMVILFTVIFVFSDARDKSTAQNVETIRTMTDSSADKMTIAVKAYIEYIKNAANYINSFEDGMTLVELKDFIIRHYDTMEFTWQIVDNFLTAPTSLATSGFNSMYFTNGQTKILMYNSYEYLELMKIFGKASEENIGSIVFTNEFTDVFTLQKSFAVTTSIRVCDKNLNETSYKTLMLVITSDKTNSVMEERETPEKNNLYNYSSVIVNKNGDYVISNHDFQGTNFIKTIEIYNADFTPENKAELLDQLNSGGNVAPIYYENIRGENSIYTLSGINATDWYVLSLVPVSSFKNADINFGSYIIMIMLLMLLIFDCSYFIFVNKRLKISLIETKEAVEEAVKANKSKSSFLSRMSHEIRTPLNAIIGYNNIASTVMTEAQTDGERDSAYRKTIDCLYKNTIASNHLLAVINDVLDMSAIESGKIKIVNELFDLKVLITSLTTVFYSQAKSKGIDFEVIISDLTGESFIGDQMRVNQVLTNLLSNAVKFTLSGGKVTMKIYRFRNSDDKSNIRFEISDTGIGMTEEYLTRIWSPFEQADSSISRRFGGTGLGMTITKNLIDMMNGNINVTSELGKGTTFTVDLVLDNAPSTEYNSHADYSAVNALVVDDNTSACDYIRTLFDICGARCSVVTSGKAAVTAVNEAIQNGKPYTVCMVDMKMPDMDGIATIKAIKNTSGANAPECVLAVYDYSEVADEITAAGIKNYIIKPLFRSTVYDFLASITKSNEQKSKDTLDEMKFKGEHILIVEDNVMNLEIALILLSNAGLTVDSAINGREAVDLFQNSPPGTYKAILMDVHMPELNGLDATRQIRVMDRPDAKIIPIIAMTADVFAENVAEVINAGMNDHIAKPIDTVKLFTVLNEYIK